MEGQFPLGIGFLIAGLVFFLLVWLLLRFVPREKPTAKMPANSLLTEIQRHQDAIIAIEAGGRIRDISAAARELFDLVPGEIPNIERLGRRVRPAEVFLEICAAEGQARFSVNGKLVDAVSYLMPGSTPAMLVALRRAETSRLQGQVGESNQMIENTNLASSYGGVFGANLELEPTVESVLVNVEKLLVADILELKVWDESEQTLIPFRMEGASAVTRTLRRGQPSPFGDYANQLVANRKELFIPDTHAAAREKPVSNNLAGLQMGSYIGIPLQVNGQLQGTLEAGAQPVNGLGEDQLRAIQMIAGEAAVALRNARLFETEQRWNKQLLGLKGLSQSIGSKGELTGLFGSIITSLSPLFDVEIIGFLLYDRQSRLLEGQIPFKGLPKNVVEIYKTPVNPESPLEKSIHKQEMLGTTNAGQDARWAELGLQDVALAAAMRDTTLVPMVSAGRFLGYLQLSNHRGGTTGLSQDEVRLLEIVKTHLSAFIDNSRLAQQTHDRNQRIDAMRAITSLVSAPASVDETLHDALQETGRLFQADAGSIFIMNESAGVMQAHTQSAFGVPAELIGPLSRINVKPASFRMTVAGSQRSFVSGDLASDQRVLPFYRAIVRKLNLSSGMVVPLIVQGKSIGELMLGKFKKNAFTRDDLNIAGAIAGQLAIVIDNALHAGEIDITLRRRADFLPVMNRISRELISTTNLGELARIVYDECLIVTGAECGSVALFEPEPMGSKERALMLQLGHAQAEIILKPRYEILEAGEPSLIPVSNGQDAPHQGIHSVLVAPITHHDEMMGYIELHATEAEGFDDIATEMVRNIGVQAALAISNSLRYAEQQNRTELFRRRADTLMELFETSKNLRIDETLLSSLDSIAHGIQKATPFNVVLVSLYDAKTDLLTRIVAAGLDDESFSQMQAHQQHWSSVAQLMKSDFELGSLYFIPVDKAPIMPADLQFLTTMTSAEKRPNAWDPDDILLLPIYDNSQNPLGLISVDAPRDGRRPDRVTLESLEIFAAQAALTITSGLNIQNYKSQIQNLSKEVNRQKNLVDYNLRSLPMLLRKDLEQTLELSQVIQRTRHIRASLQLTEAISRQVDSGTALMMLGQQVLASFGMSMAIVARETSDGPQIAHVSGNLPSGVNPETSFGQRNPLRVCLQTGEAIVCDNVDEDINWHDTPFLANLRAKSFICIPVVVNNKPIAAVMATDTETLPTLSAEDRQVYTQAGKEVSIIMQNISLLSETRQRLREVNLLLDFSRQLSGLKPEEILKSLLNSALRVVSPAHAGVVFLWDPHAELLEPMAAANYVNDALIMKIAYHAGEGLPGKVFAEKFPQRKDEVNFVTDYNLPPEDLSNYREATGGRLPVSSMIVPIMTGDHELGVLVLDNFNTPAAFQPVDEAILVSLTQQVALALENVRLMQTTQERAGQLQALNVAAATLSSSLQRDELVYTLLDRMATVIPYDTAILWLRQENRMVVADARGFDDNEERKGLTVAVGDSTLLEEMTRTGHAIVVDDVRSDPRFTSLVQPRFLAWMGIPLITKGQVIGVLAIEKLEARFYTNEYLQ
ncbi:MAG TPA: GAF domain-containing protein, partial [Anaerolineales bacterium]